MKSTTSMSQEDQKTKLLETLKTGQTYLVKAPTGHGFLLCHRFHTEVIGDGALVGGAIDLNCQRLIPLGEPSLVHPESREERFSGYRVRESWIELTQRLIETDVPLRRARNILGMLESNFDREAITGITDEILASIAGVLPKTIAIARQRAESPLFSTRSETTKELTPQASPAA